MRNPLSTKKSAITSTEILKPILSERCKKNTAAAPIARMPVNAGKRSLPIFNEESKQC